VSFFPVPRHRAFGISDTRLLTLSSLVKAESPITWHVPVIGLSAASVTQSGDGSKTLLP
jgi:hypothetical protein